MSLSLSLYLYLLLAVTKASILWHPSLFFLLAFCVLFLLRHILLFLFLRVMISVPYALPVSFYIPRQVLLDQLHCVCLMLYQQLTLAFFFLSC